MKSFTTILFLLFASSVVAQTTVSKALDSAIVKILQSDGILLTQAQKDCEGNCTNLGLWKNNRKKKKWLVNDEKLKARFLNKFKVPSFAEKELVSNELTFPNKSIGLIGSYLIRNNDLSVLNTTITPTLPILKNGRQVGVFSPNLDGSNYVLNYTSHEFFQGKIEGDVSSGFMEYYQLKLQASTNLGNDKRNQISIGAGVFENQLAKIYDNIEHIDAADFEPIYYLWLEHRKGNIQPNDKIIKSFSGLCYFSSQGVEKTQTEIYSAELNSSGKYPFLGYNLSSTGKWTNSIEEFGQRNDYNIFMFKRPDFTNVPTKEEILKCWDKVKSSSHIISLNSSDNIPANTPLTIKVKFGPVPNKNVLNLIELDEDYTLKSLPVDKKFIKSLRLVTDDPSRITNQNGYYTFDVEILRDEVFLRENVDVIGSIISAEVPLRIYYNNPIGNDTLDIKYRPINLTTELFPTPSSDYEISGLKDVNVYKYNTLIRFNVSNQPIVVVSNPKPPKVVDVFGLPTSIAQSLKNHLTESSFQLRTINEYSFNFSIPQTNNYFDINHRSHEIEVLLEFYANNGRTYKRKFPLKLLAPKEMLEQSTASTILISNNGELISSLNLDALLVDDIKVSEFVNSYTKNGDTDVLGLVDALQVQKIINITPDGNYIVPANLINVDKIRN